MTELEKQINELRVKLDEIAERVRLDAVARAFLDNVRGAASVRSGDIALIDGHPTRVRIADNGIGKWTFTTGNGGCVEAFRVPPSDDIERLYTPEEVAEILASSNKREVPPSGAHTTIREIPRAPSNASLATVEIYPEHDQLTRIRVREPSFGKASAFLTLSQLIEFRDNISARIARLQSEKP